MDCKLLLDALVSAVKQMRDYQKMLAPGAPLALRQEAHKWEQEVDALVELHLLPEVPDFPNAGATS